ncbi:MAG: type II secretion system protein [Synergistaceae bacterium]|nr:type II secretion system protein [Synergistaceae bacterium]
MRSRAFSLVELAVSITIMGIMAGAVVLNMDSLGGQSAQLEAEKAAAYIQTYLRRADITQNGVWLNIQENYIDVCTGIQYDSNAVKKLEASPHCSYSTSDKGLRYNTDLQPTPSSNYKLISKDSIVSLSENITAQYRITVKGADNKYCDILIGK